MELSKARVKPYVLPSRKAFADFVTRIFLRYGEETLKDNEEDADTDPCLAREGGSAAGDAKLFPFQELVRDYLQEESPYRGLIVYHGLGSGKTRSAIGVAESLLTTKPIYVLLPASLKQNFIGEIMGFGNPLYMRNNHWVYYGYGSNVDMQRRAQEILKVPDSYIAEHDGIWINDAAKDSNWETLSAEAKKQIAEQIQETIRARYRFITYNGDLQSEAKVADLVAPDSDGNPTKNPFHHSTVIVDEAHNFITAVFNESRLKMPVYKALLEARDCKVVLLSGTPMINNPVELAYMLNLVRGVLTSFYIPSPPPGSSLQPEQLLKDMPELDMVDFDVNRRAWVVTRNPQFFVKVGGANSSGVRFDKDQNKAETDAEFAEELQQKLTAAGWRGLTPTSIVKRETTALPTDRNKFFDMFVDQANLRAKNEQLFMRRILGLVSYFKSANPKTLPTRIAVNDTLVRIPMSPMQFNEYQKARLEEIKLEANMMRAQKGSDDSFGTYRVLSRMVCNYALPPELKPSRNEEGVDGALTEDQLSRKDMKKEVVAIVRANPEKYFSTAALDVYSPKFAAMLQRIQESEGNQFVYSQFRSAEGLGFFGEALAQHGFQQYKVKREGGSWVEDLSDPTSTKPCFVFYSGEEELEEREIYLAIYNNQFDSNRIPAGILQSLRKRFGDSLDNLRGNIIRVFMASKAGAEGITLKNCRHVHIMEPYWGPALMDQVVGRAIRTCSHSALPESERTVTVNIYMSVFGEAEINSNDNNAALIRKKDMMLKRYLNEFRESSHSNSTGNNNMGVGGEGGGAVPPPMEPGTTDESLYEIAYEKRTLANAFTGLLKQSAVDCEVHKRAHAKGDPQMHCMAFTGASVSNLDDFSFRPDMAQDPKDDEISMNLVRQTVRLQKIRVGSHVFVLNPESKTLYDWRVFEQSNRLLEIGKMEADRLIFV